MIYMRYPSTFKMKAMTVKELKSNLADRCNFICIEVIIII